MWSCSRSFQPVKQVSKYTLCWRSFKTFPPISCGINKRIQQGIEALGDRPFASRLVSVSAKRLKCQMHADRILQMCLRLCLYVFVRTFVLRVGVGRARLCEAPSGSGVFHRDPALLAAKRGQSGAKAGAGSPEAKAQRSQTRLASSRVGREIRYVISLLPQSYFHGWRPDHLSVSALPRTRQMGRGGCPTTTDTHPPPPFGGGICSAFTNPPLLLLGWIVSCSIAADQSQYNVATVTATLCSQSRKREIKRSRHVTSSPHDSRARISLHFPA